MTWVGVVVANTAMTIVSISLIDYVTPRIRR